LALVLLPLSAQAAEGEPAPAEKGEGKAEEEKEPDWEATADFVGGSTSTDVLNEGRPTRVELPPANVFDSTRITTFSFVFGLERHIGKKLTVGARMPIIDAELRSRSGAADPRSVFMAGNLELEGEYKIAHAKTWEVFGALGLAIPTGGGKEQPTADEVAADKEKRFDYRRYDRWAAGRAASFVRGAYDSALFEAGRFGIVPKVGAEWKAGKLSVEPTLKVENLIDVTGDAAESYIGELVGGVRASYLVVPHVEPLLHAWASAVFAGAGQEKDTTFIVVSPGVKFPFEHVVTPEVGAIVPLVGHLWDDKTWGVRVAVVGEF
jgi:hypothetical protein